MSIFNYLNQERTGATTFEWTILSGFTFALSFICLFFMLAVFSWVSFSSLAGNIAQDINFRQTGFSKFTTDIDLDVNVNNPIDKEVDVVVSLGDDTKGYTINNSYYANYIVGNAFKYSMNKNSEQFLFPYTNVDAVRINISRPDGSTPTLKEASGSYGNRYSANNFASSIVNVRIDYTFLPIMLWSGPAQGGLQGYYWGPIKFSTTGYSVIT